MRRCTTRRCATAARWCHSPTARGMTVMTPFHIDGVEKVAASTGARRRPAQRASAARGWLFRRRHRAPARSWRPGLTPTRCFDLGLWSCVLRWAIQTATSPDDRVLTAALYVLTLAVVAERFWRCGTCGRPTGRRVHHCRQASHMGWSAQLAWSTDPRCSRATTWIAAGAGSFGPMAAWLFGRRAR